MKKGILLLLVLLLISPVVFSEEQSATHTYTAPGEYAVTFTATDEHGAVGSETLTISVRGNEAPVITIDRVSGTISLEVQFTATITDPEGDAIVEYSWDFGDTE